MSKPEEIRPFVQWECVATREWGAELRGVVWTVQNVPFWSRYLVHDVADLVGARDFIEAELCAMMVARSVLPTELKHVTFLV